jgi:hypothetical protein
MACRAMEPAAGGGETWLAPPQEQSTVSAHTVINAFVLTTYYFNRSRQGCIVILNSRLARPSRNI